VTNKLFSFDWVLVSKMLLSTALESIFFPWLWPVIHKSALHAQAVSTCYVM